ncbi:hypothetical protein [Rhizobium sp. CRRU65]|uniref:hypothetical protein n=1 Tax=Rhizobium sp. CRRU65 TaxID=3399566 RepID=UPI003AF546D8
MLKFETKFESLPNADRGHFLRNDDVGQSRRGMRDHGELYELDAIRLPVLDKLEDVGKPGSFRRIRQVALIGGGVPISAIGYLQARSG